MYISIYHYFSEITGPIETELGKNFMLDGSLQSLCFLFRLEIQPGCHGH